MIRRKKESGLQACRSFSRGFSYGVEGKERKVREKQVQSQQGRETQFDLVVSKKRKEEKEEKEEESQGWWMVCATNSDKGNN